MFSNEEVALMNQLCQVNPDVSNIIRKLQEENRQTLSVFTHEVSNYFTFINSTVQIMENKSPQLKDFPHWNQLSKDVKELSALLRELSSYNHCSNLNITNVNLVTLLKDIFSCFTETAIQKNIAFTIEGSMEIPYLTDYLCDHIKLRQVFFNIVKNAFEATGPGNFIKIILPDNPADLYVCDTDASFFVISIVNNGDPIPEDKIDSIFTPFITTKATGTGLGLSIVHKIISAHGGNIKAKSSEELTCFSIYLPIRKTPSLSDNSVAS